MFMRCQFIQLKTCMLSTLSNYHMGPSLLLHHIATKQGLKMHIDRNANPTFNKKKLLKIYAIKLARDKSHAIN